MATMIRRVLFVLVCAFLFTGNAHFSSAALLYIDPDVTEAFRGDTVTLGVRLDTSEDECINTVDATIHYDPSVRAVDVSTGNSILNIWVESPRIDEEAHTITFAGGLPGGYCGRVPGDPTLTNTLVELIFRIPGLSIGTGDNSVARITFDESSQALLHDGRGTRAQLTLSDGEIRLGRTIGTEVEDNWRDAIAGDDIPPTEFSITLTKDPVAFGGKYFIVFNSNDKQSGIDHYEVIEEPFEQFELFTWGAANAPWQIITSPYVLKDQSLNSTIRVKAIDKAGNETISVLIPDTALRSMSTKRRTIVFSASGAGALLFGLMAYALWRRRRELKLPDTSIDTDTHV